MINKIKVMLELVKNNEVIRFDRHANMDSKTRKAILDLISDIQFEILDPFELENSLYGLFDGYNYFFTNLLNAKCKINLIIIHKIIFLK